MPSLSAQSIESVHVTGYDLTIDEVHAVARAAARVCVAAEARARVARGRAIVDGIVAGRTPTYGVNTGVGSQKDYGLDEREIGRFNRRLLNAHATSVPGPELRPEVVRAAMTVQANLFATGACGVRPDILDLIIERLHENRLPVVDAAGSVGASDLVPLAQMALGLMAPGPDAEAFEPAAKEALSLMNSNAISLGRGALVLHDARRLLAAFDLCAAAALEGLRGNLESISDPVTRVHRRRGHGRSASRMRALLAGSRLWQPGEARFLQDPLSFRGASQVHGAADSAMEWVWQVWETELNTVSDNPLIDLESGRAVSHANMDSGSLTLAMDTLRQALAKVADLSGERLHKQHWPTFSGLPTGLAREAGAMGGVQFLNLGHIAASLIASMKLWANPVLPLSIGQLADGVEDTAGLAMHAVADADRIVEAGWKVATLEAIVACWAIDRRGLRLEDLGVGVRPLYETLRPMLPIGREGEEPFDLTPVVARFAESDLLERCLAGAGTDCRPSQ